MPAKGANCEQATFEKLVPALLVRPTGGIIEVTAGEIDGRLVLEGDIGLGPADAMAAALALRAEELQRTGFLARIPRDLSEAARSFGPQAMEYRQAWAHVMDTPESAVRDTRAGRRVEELNAWLRGEGTLSALPYGSYYKRPNQTVAQQNCPLRDRLLTGKQDWYC